LNRAFLMSLSLSLLSSSELFAQTPPLGEPEASKARVQIGPFWLKPTLSITDAGVDTNVFNEADQNFPKSDFTMTVTPAADLWLRMGPTWLTSRLREDLVYYNKYVGERSANSSYAVGWLAPMTRISVKTTANWSNTRSRPGFEIDARALRLEHGYDGAIEVRALARTLIGVRAGRQMTRFADNAVFLGQNLGQELNRTGTDAALTLRHEITPLTTLLLAVGRTQERFEFSSDRDSDSREASLGLTFDPTALISGTAQIGYRDFQPLSSDLPGFTGTTMGVSLSYVAAGTAKLTVEAKRDIEYSFEVAQPYYLLTGVIGTLSQQIFGPLDLQARVGQQQLEYRNRGVLNLEGRIDHVKSYGGGLGYRMSPTFRLGVNVDQQKRESGIQNRAYTGLRYGISMTYGE
jgi:hypothetical protein